MPSQTAAPVLEVGDALDALAQTRASTLALVAHLDDDVLERVHSPLMSPLVWDLGHIAAFEDLWLVHRFDEAPLLRPELARVYDAFETPRADRGELPYLRRADALAYLAAVRGRTLEAVARRGVGDGVLHELVVRHELQHTETMLQTMQLAHLPAPPGRFGPQRAPRAAEPPPNGLELVDVPAGPCAIGAGPDGFAYDNERPRHTLELPVFRIGRAPITNATFLTFVEGGGYERREWWTDEAWAWKQEYDVERPGGWTADGREWRMDRCEPLDPHRPVVHVSWFEADAFARAHDARLPTEPEWEKAATWDQQPESAQHQPWGSAPLDMVGEVWEWTASRFDGYPGFAATPYREYSEVFFGGGYRVLRGGSQATSARVATPTFRNWDHPQRRQIFAGLRIAKDA